MPKIKLPYGDRDITLKIPAKNFAGFFAPKKIAQKKGPKTLIEEAMRKPLGKKLESLCAGKNVCCLIEDSTRAEPYDLIAEAFAKRLRKAKSVRFVITTGTHTALTRENKRIARHIEEAAQRHGLRYKIHIHDCRKDDMRYAGTTSFKNKVYVSSFAEKCDMFVVASDSKNHYFSGYSNPVKDFLPGICGFSTIERNHSFALDKNSTFGRHPLHPDRKMRKCPVAEDQYEAAQLIFRDRPVFVLGMISSGGKVYYATAGGLKRVIRDLIKKIDRLTSFKVRPQRHIIVSPGHYPDDSTLYVSQRALELTKNAVKKGGEILFFSECRDGVTYDEHTMKEFYLPMKQPLAKMLAIIKKKYVLYSHKAYKFAELIRHTKAIHVHSGLDKKWFEGIHLKTTDDPQSVVDRWIKKDRNAKILVFSEANKLAIYNKK